MNIILIVLFVIILICFLYKKIINHSNIEILTTAYDWYVQNMDDFKYSSGNKSGSMHRQPLKKGLLNLAKLISRLF